MTPPVAAADTALANIIILVTNEQCHHDLGCYGLPNAKTPHIDQLTAEGIRFTDFYSAVPGCSASRAGLMTGLLSKAEQHSHAALHPEEVTIAEI